MHIIISYESGVPIYEQIKNEIRGQILSGELKEGEPLPSIRMLAKELKVGIITAKRAYDDLCAEGFCHSLQGKGIFVSGYDRGRADDFALNEIKSRLDGVIAFAQKNSVDKQKLKKILIEYTENKL